jgi:hypothetical protein
MREKQKRAGMKVFCIQLGMKNEIGNGNEKTGN